jgi:hypothetical protein
MNVRTRNILRSYPQHSNSLRLGVTACAAARRSGVTRRFATVRDISVSPVDDWETFPDRFGVTRGSGVSRQIPKPQLLL